MNAILEGASVTEVSQLLKHKSIGVTTIYLHATDKDGDRVSRKLGKRYARHLTSIPQTGQENEAFSSPANLLIHTICSKHSMPLDF